ncbi:TPA: hypothetical protein QCR61_003894 [Bacillus cereus]|nr:hypothetical protein [Bacillus cereus]HDR4861597.1 hypothetical protein [Bacillus cereus]
MYNNYWNPNHDMMFQKAVPSVDPNHRYAPNYVSSVDPNYQYSPNAITNVDSYNQNTSGIQVPNFQNSDDGRQTRKKISLTAIKGRGTDLGDGFESFSWDAGQISYNEYLLVFMDAPEMKVINGGWAPNDEAPLYAMENYPRKINQWVITLFNEKPGNPRPIRFFLIAKS